MSYSEFSTADPAHLYRPSLGLRLFGTLFGALGLALGLGCIAMAFWWPEPFWEIWLRGFVVAAGLGVALSAVYAAIGSMVTAVSLYPDRIELRGVLRSRSLQRENITGFRAVVSYSILSLTFVSRVPGEKSLKVTPGPLDNAFMQWLEGLPDLDAVEAEAAEAEALADPALGPDEAARRERLTRVGTWARIPNLLGYAIGAWVWFWPRPYEAAVATAAAAPAVALILIGISRGTITLEPGGKAQPRPTLGGLMVAGVALLIRGVMDVQLLDWSQALAASAVLGSLICAVAWAVDRRAFGKAGTGVFIWVCATAYAWGLVVEADMILDHARPETYRVAVLAKSVSSGKTTTYNLDLPPWGPFAEHADVSAPRSVYDKVAVGQVVCAYVNQGALRIRWYDVWPCPPKNGR